MSFFRGRVLALGVILTVAGGGTIWSAISHQLKSVETTATVLGHSSECNVEYQLVISDHRTDEIMECDAAMAFQTRMGKEKVVLTRYDYAKLRYADLAGKQHETKLVEASLVAHDAPVGSPVRIFYDPAKPEDARAPVTMGLVGPLFCIMLFGVFMTLIGLGMGPVRMIKALMGGSRGASKPLAAGLDWSEEAVGERLRGAAAAAGVSSSPAPWQSPSAAPMDAPVASPWATASAQPSYAGNGGASFGKRRA